MRLKALYQKAGAIASAIPFRAWLLGFVVVGGIIGLGAFTVAYAKGFSYISDDPRACANCHVMREVFDGWNHGSHKAVAVCNDCHTPHSSILAKYAVKALNGMKHSIAFTLDDIPEPIRIVPFDREIAYENCLGCHGAMVSTIAHVDDPKTPTDCFSCHDDVGHRN